MIPEPRVDLKLLHSFVAVAETLHFGRAAEQSFLSVGTISTRIKDLERRLGYAVFERSSREVSLTPQGANLLAQVKPILEAVTKIADRSVRKVNIAFNQDTNIPPVMAAIERLKVRAVEIDIERAYDDELLRLLESRSADLTIGWSDLDGVDALRSTELVALPVSVVVQTGDPLAMNDVVTPNDVVDHHVVLFDRQLAPNVYDALAAWVEGADRVDLDYSTPVFQSQSGMAGSASTRKRTITFTSGIVTAGHDLVTRPVEPPVVTPIWATTRSDDVDLLNEFVELVQEY